jgi:hypothetical protein
MPIISIGDCCARGLPIACPYARGFFIIGLNFKPSIECLFLALRNRYCSATECRLLAVLRPCVGRAVAEDRATLKLGARHFRDSVWCQDLRAQPW